MKNEKANTTVTIRINPKLIRLVKQRAKADDRSTSSYIKLVLQKHLQEVEQGNEKLAA